MMVSEPLFVEPGGTPSLDTKRSHRHFTHSSSRPWEVLMRDREGRTGKERQRVRMTKPNELTERKTSDRQTDRQTDRWMIQLIMKANQSSDSCCLVVASAAKEGRHLALQNLCRRSSCQACQARRHSLSHSKSFSLDEISDMLVPQSARQGRALIKRHVANAGCTET